MPEAATRQWLQERGVSVAAAALAVATVRSQAVELQVAALVVVAARFDCD